jgi:nucleoside-diphosphate kinase
MQRTLSIIKPDGVRKGLIGEVHRERPFFGSLTEFMSSGPVVVLVLEGDDVIARNRALMGATDPKKAEKGTIRADFADNVEWNIVHGSDAPETAETEIRYFFSDLDQAIDDTSREIDVPPARRTYRGPFFTRNSAPPNCPVV